MVDRLLASPHYGERWGRHWMDVVRYADTAGDNADYPIPEAARYRDYIIDSFNADKPYDQFVREQLAGDILAQQGSPGTDAEAVVATGFLALSRRYAHRALRALAPDARRHHRHDRPGVPRADASLCPLPRPQVRPGHAARLLRALRDLRQHDVSPTPARKSCVTKTVPADEFRASGCRRSRRAEARAIPRPTGELEGASKALEPKSGPTSQGDG